MGSSLDDSAIIPPWSSDVPGVGNPYPILQEHATISQAIHSSWTASPLLPLCRSWQDLWPTSLYCAQQVLHFQLSFLTSGQLQDCRGNETPQETIALLRGAAPSPASIPGKMAQRYFTVGTKEDTETRMWI